MHFKHANKTPQVHDSAYVAATATLCGNVVVGAHASILFGAVIVAEGAQVVIEEHCVIMENAVVRGTQHHPVHIGRNSLVGPHAHLSGCVLEDRVFIATGATILNGARVGTGAEVRINGVVHINTVLAAHDIVPIGWVAVGNPAAILPPEEHQRIWDIQKTLNFPEVVFGVDRTAAEPLMEQITRRYAAALATHKDDDML